MATIQTAVNAIRATGIEPFGNIFRDEDFQPSLTTDMPTVELTAPAFEILPESLIEHSDSAITPTANYSPASKDPQPQSMTSQTKSQFMDLTPSTSLALSPLPVANERTARRNCCRFFSQELL